MFWTPLNALSMGKAERMYKYQFVLVITRRFSELVCPLFYRSVHRSTAVPPLYRSAPCSTAVPIALPQCLPLYRIAPCSTEGPTALPKCPPALPQYPPPYRSAPLLYCTHKHKMCLKTFSFHFCPQRKGVSVTNTNRLIQLGQ
jgi:hypothetical protein